MPKGNETSHRLAAILFADIEGYTSLMQEGESKAMSILSRFESITETKVKEHKGEVVKKYGDGCLILFNSAVSSVKCAYEMQSAFREEPLVPLRIGIHVGEVVHKNNDVFGNGVNIASRIESIGLAGSVLMSKDVHKRINNQEIFKTQSLGVIEFKNVEEGIEVFALANEGFVIPLRSEMKGKLKQDFKQPYRKATLGIVFISAIILFLFAQLLYNRYMPKGITLPVLEIQQTQKMAVLPFLNLNSTDENLEYFSDGVTQEIIDELAQIKSFVMTAFTSTMPYKNSPKSHGEIANELDVTYLISGSSRIYSEGDSIRLSIELIDTKSNNQRIWHGNFNEKMDNAPSIQLSIAKQVANSLNIELTPGEVSSLQDANTSSGEAFRLFLLARSEFNKLNGVGFRNSIKACKMALDLDPNYAQVHTFLAWSYILGANPWLQGHFDHSFDELRTLAMPHLERALELEPNSSDTYLVRANLNVYFNGLLRDGNKDVEHALKINSWPLVPTNYCICTVVSSYLALDQLDKAEEVAKLAGEVDPGNVFIYWDEGNVLMKRGKYSESITKYEIAAKVAPIPMFQTFHGWSHFHNGNLQEALVQLEEAYNISEVPAPFNVAYLSIVHNALGNNQLSDYYHNQLLSRIELKENHVHMSVALIHAAKNEMSQALDWLEIAQLNKEFGFAVLSGLDPLFKPLYDHARFKEIRKKMQYYE